MDYEDDSSVSSSSTELSPTSSCSHTPPPKRKAGRKKFRETRHPVYRGVRERKGGKWVCEVREPGSKTRIWLGTYPTPEMAARAHDVSAIALRGKSAQLNFADSAWVLPQAKSSSHEDIRCAATKAAERYRPGTPTSSSRKGKDAEEEAPARAPAYVDEEELFNMPGLIDSMAEGLMLTPPGMHRGVDWDEAESSDMDLSLWS